MVPEPAPKQRESDVHDVAKVPAVERVPRRLDDHHGKYRDASAPPSHLGVEVGHRIAGAPVEIGEEGQLRGRQQQQRRECAGLEALLPVAAPGERGDQRDSHRAGQHGQRADRAAPPPAAVPGERERPQRQQQEQALRVGQREHEREREDRQVQHRPPCHAAVVTALGDPVEHT